MTQPEKLLELQEVTKEFGQGDSLVAALRGVSLQIGRGDYLAITGPSGSGKSTLLYLMGLLHRPTSGSFFIWGRNLKNVKRLERAALRNRHIGFVFQDSLLLSELPVIDNVELPLYYANVPRPKRRQQAMALLEELGLAHLRNQKAKNLSGGERQRVAIARALVNDPGLVLADEPTGSLDKANGDKVLAMFDYLHQKDITVVIVTHDPTVAARCQNNIQIADGKVVARI